MFKKIIRSMHSTYYNYKSIACILFYTLALAVQFSQSVYTNDESSGGVPVTLLLIGGTSSSDINVTVIPSDQSPLSAEGKRCVCPRLTS